MSPASNTTSTPSNFEAVFNSALTEYTKQTGKDLRDNSFASKIDGCDNPDSIIAIFQDQAKEFNEFRNGDIKLFKWFKPVIKVLHALSTNETLSGIASHVFPPAKAVFSGIDILLSTAKDVSASYDALVDIFECIENFLRRLNIYNEIPPTLAMTEVVIKIMAEIITVLALATRQMKQGRFKKYAKKILGEKEIESVLDRLNRLTLEESKMTAAQTLEVVCRLVNNMHVVMEDGKVSTDDIRQTLVTIQEVAVKVHKIERDQMQEKFCRWLSAPDPWINQNVAHKAHHDGTATWFTQGDIFKTWKSTGSLMWIHGLPGSGKSVLCSSIIEDIMGMCPTGLASLAFFYFDFRDVGKQNARSLLSSLLIQLSLVSEKCSGIISSLHSAHGNGSREPSEDVLLKSLKDMLKLPGQGELYIVVDALDECPNVSGFPTPREQVLKVLQELVELRLPHVNFCITSRPEVDIRDALDGLAAHNISLHEQAGQNRDIFDYITSVVSSDPKMLRWREEDKQLVIETLMKKAGGMFRWVYCQIETLRRCFPASIRRTLNELPETLDGTYEQTLRSIDKQKRDYAYRLFQCLVVSKRPLRVQELAELFAIQPDAESIPAFDATLRPENPEEFILSACSTLVAIVNVGYGYDEDEDKVEIVLEVEVENGDEIVVVSKVVIEDEDEDEDEYKYKNLYPDEKIVQFSHFSVREYLISDRIASSEHVSRFHILPRPAHALLARACLGVLLQLDDHIVRDEDQNPPLVSYAARHWVDHAHFEDVSSDIHYGMKLLFDRDKPYFVSWLRVYQIDKPLITYKGSISPSPDYPAPLYYAARCGFRDIATHLLDAHPQDVNTRGGMDETPLLAALDNGHPSVAILLLERGANVGAQDFQGRTPLHIALFHGYNEVISLLVDRGADPNAETKNRETSLYLALKFGRKDVARLLLDHSADPDSKNPKGLTLLRAAWEDGHVDNVQLLLDYGADAKSPDNGGNSPLHVVLQDPPFGPNPTFLEHRLDIIILLLEHGADANYPDNLGWTPLHIALQRGLIDIARLLLNHGADANSSNWKNYGLTSLHFASQEGLIDIVQLLLHHGADANYPDNFGWTPLLVALRGGLIDVVWLLLNHGADPNLSYPNNHGGTPLHFASHGGSIDFAQLLLHHGADANYQDNYGQTPLHIALRGGLIDFVRLLLNHDADANLSYPNNHGRTPLHTASQVGFTDIVRLLLHHGADANRLDKYGQTPLHVASREGHDDIVGSLLNHGVESDADHSNGDGWTALHTASQEGHENIVQLLLDHGADANRSDNCGWSPLHAASQEGHDTVVRLLLDYGAAADHTDRDGWSPLHAASRRGHDDIVRSLLNHGVDVNHSDSDGRTALHTASREGHDYIVRLLLDHGAAPNRQDNRGRTPLHGAWRKRNSHQTSPCLLLRPDAGANRPSSYGWIPLPRVSRNSRKGGNDTVRLLLKHGADAHRPDSDGLTPLHLARLRAKAAAATTSTSYFSVTAQR